ncbi:FG-GAP repeat domain-containing protein [Candidatus Omnitrophota bacterium]
MKTNTILAAAVLIAFSLFLNEPLCQLLKKAQFPTFEYHLIDKIGGGLGQTSLADVDNDGDLDWICGQKKGDGGEIWWWEYKSPDNWIRHLMGYGDTDVGGSAYDINGDGWIDMFSGKKILLNPGSPRKKQFAEYTVGTTYSHDSVFGDIDGDGNLDAIANWDNAGLFWYEIPKDPTKQWISHTIETADTYKIHGGVSPHAIGDIDGDGDNDVVTGQAWYKNQDGTGLVWKQHKNIEFGEYKMFGLAVKTWLIDMNGDGALDIVQTEADSPDGRVAWLENDGHGNWTRHLIKDKGDQQDFHSLIVADFDGDGDMDVFSGGGPLSGAPHKCYIWENTAGTGKNPTSRDWIEHIVAEKPCHEAVGGDVDGDGDIDICSKPWRTGNEHFYLKNMTMEMMSQ